VAAVKILMAKRVSAVDKAGELLEKTKGRMKKAGL